MSSHKPPGHYSASKHRQQNNKLRSSGSIDGESRTRSHPRNDQKSPDNRNNYSVNGRYKTAGTDGSRRGSDELLDVHHTWNTEVENKIKSIYIQRHPDAGLGLSIRGGAEHGIGIYISSIEPGSVADRQGLCAGDQILSLNGVAFTNIPHQQAAEMISMCEILDMEVRCVGRIPGSYESLQTYTWVEPGGRMVSPPPEVDRVSRYDMVNRGSIKLKEADERKVNIILHDGARLGFLIRGGREFGLGIYITGVDRGSLAESGGIKPGDQILDVNGHSFLDISHVEAVQVLKSSRHLVLTIKDVGKIPHTHSTHSAMHWDEVQPSYNQAGFVRGVGSQVMHTSTKPTQWSLLEDKASQLLAHRELELLVYYLKGYDGRMITIDALVLALFELLDTPQKLNLMNDIRCFIKSQDIVLFDDMALNRHSVQTAPETREGTYQSRRTSFSKTGRQNASPKLDVLRSPSDDSGVDVNSGLAYSDTQHRVTYSDQQSYHSLQHEDSYHRQVKEPLRQRRSYPGLQTTSDPNTLSHSYPTNQARRHSNYDLWSKQGNHSDNDMYGKYSSSNDVNGTYESDYSTDLDVYNHSEIRQPVRPPRKKAHFRSSRTVKGGDVNNSVEMNGWQQKNNIQQTRPGILKDSGNSQFSRRERVPCIKIENWEDMKSKLERNLPPELKQPETVHKPPKKDNGRQYRQKFKLTPDEMTILKLKVRVKLDEIEKNRMMRELAAVSGDKEGGDTKQDKPFTVTQHKLVKPKPVEEIIKENNKYDPNRSKASKGVRLTDNGGTDAHLYSQNWDKKRSEILEKQGGGKKLERHESDSFESPLAKLNAAAKVEQSQQLSSPTRTQLKKVTLYKTQPTLGLALEGGANTKQPLPRIVSIKENGSAFNSELTRGQLILEVNGRSLRELSHTHCAQVIADAYKDPTSHYVEFLVVDKSSTSHHELTEL